MLSKSKQVGTVGELAVTIDLLNMGYDVYTSVGDCTKIDLIAIKNNVIHRHQVKTFSKTTSGVICIEASKVISRKKIKYDFDDFDYLTIFAKDRNLIAYVPMTYIHGRAISLRFNPPLRNVKSFHKFEDYESP